MAGADIGFLYESSAHVSRVRAKLTQVTEDWRVTQFLSPALKK